jgi:hypothetical protein
MAFRPNYNRDRSERDRAARARSDEKQRKKDEKTALRKAQREGNATPPAIEAPEEENMAPEDEKPS